MPPLIFFLFTLLFQPSSKEPLAPARPFPQHSSYEKNCILPSHIGRHQMDDSVRVFYSRWKDRYIRPGCNAGEYYVRFEGPTAGNKLCVSEGQGYGMLIVALMAGYDTAAHTIFDGLYRYYRAHPARRAPYLMAWAQKKNCRDVDSTTATDGDMDIAYSLLLADAQWGSLGGIDYRDMATQTMASILKQEVNQKTFSIMLSNAIEDDGRDYFDMRSSDFMPDHIRLFHAVSKDTGWQKALDNNYRLFQNLQQKFSPETGLIPDFINNVNIQPAPARGRYLESKYDGSYNYNACRVPWRIASDYILHGDPRAAAIVGKINRWIQSTTQGNPDNISAGYSLGGEDLKNRYYEALCFIAPFTVAAMVGKENQPWLNKCWDYLVKQPAEQFDYYDNSIRVICMIILSGNYWAPEG